MAFRSEFCLAISRAEQWLERINLLEKALCAIRSFRIEYREMRTQMRKATGRIQTKQTQRAS